jgi:type IV pilus assembly protein PilX
VRVMTHLDRKPARKQRQQGVVMFVALVVLIVMTLAGLAMLRQLGGSLSIAGNVAFKQGATSIADAGAEAGRALVVAPGAALDTDAKASGYYSSWGNTIDPSQFDWSQSGTANGGTSDTVRFIVHRLCKVPGLSANAPAQQCSDVGAVNGGGGKGGSSYGSLPTTPAMQPYFRVTTRVDGPRNTTSYTQVVMQ